MNSQFKIECTVIEADWFKKFFEAKENGIATYRIKNIPGGHKEERKKLVTAFF